MVASVVAATFAESLLLRRWPARSGWLGVALTTLGLASLLVALSPSAGAATATPPPTAVLALAGLSLTVLAGAALWAQRSRAGGIALSVATGLGYGVTAVALKTVGAELASGWTTPLDRPALGTAVVVGPLSVLASQHALRRARALTAAVSVMLVIDPVVGLFAGTAWFGEHVLVTPASLVSALAAGTALLTGIVLSHTARRPSPHHRAANADHRGHPRLFA